MENSPKDFFISYNGADVDWGMWIAEHLEKAGYTTIIQAWDFLPGENFVLKMQEAAMQAKTTIAVLSDYYLQANFTQAEWAAAFAQDPTGKQRKLIPVRVRPCQPGGLFTSIISIDLVDQDEDIASQRLLAGVSPNPTPRRGPASFPGKASADKSHKASSSSGTTGSFLSPKPAVFPRHLPPIHKTLDVFIVYSPKDKDYLEKINTQLAFLQQKGLIKTWSNNDMLAGSDIEREFNAHWDKAQIILLLVSSDLINDSYEKIQRAIARDKDESARIIPILLRPCLSDLQEQFDVLPLNGKPITGWANRDEAYYDIARGIGEAAKQLLHAAESA